MDIEKNAERIAREAHKHQRRKWGDNSPYIVHPERLVAKAKTMKGMNEVDYAALWAHDVLEDVAWPENKMEYYKELIRTECGEEVLNLVWELTSPTEAPEWKGRPRVEKRAADWEHLSGISDRAKRLKMIDRLDNIADFKGAPSRMIDKYIPESRHLLGLLRHVDEELGDELEKAIDKLAARR